MTTTKALPRIVPHDEWLEAREELLVKEKQLTRALDALAAERRRLPMVRFSKDYVFEGSADKVSLLGLFDQRRQLVVYHFMWPGAPQYCPGCSSFVDNIGQLAHLHARDTSVVLVSDGPLAEIAPYKERMGWTVPWYSAQGSARATGCFVPISPERGESTGSGSISTFST